jgi:hypothetical protein
MARTDTWFRFYNTTLDNPKAQRLSGDLFKGWVNLLCLASKRDGVLPSVSDIAFALRMDETEIETLLETLHARGLLDLEGDDYTPHDWDELQFKSDKSTDRVAKYRERQKKKTVSGNVTGNVAVTAQEQNRTEHRREDISAHAVVADQIEVEAIKAYNDLAGELAWPKCEKISASRKSKLRARLRDCGGIDGWYAALARAKASKFLRGETGRGAGHENWTPNIDFFLTESKFLKLIEGGFDGSTAAPAVTTIPTQTLTDEDWRSAMRRFKADAKWPGVGYGPQPGYGGCVVPTKILAEFNLESRAA